MFILQLLLTALAAYLAAKFTPGVNISGFWNTILLAIVLGLLDTFVKPVLQFFSLPLTLLTMGLFLLVINALIVMMASGLMSSFKVDGFWSALIFSVIFSVVSWIINAIFLGAN